MVDRIGWDVFLDRFMDTWQQGEHVAILGTTGGGKSVLGTKLVMARAEKRSADVVTFGTKPRDDTLTAMGWPIIKSWDDREYGQKQVILWPPYGDPETAALRQSKVFAPIMRKLFMEGDRTIYIDEIRDFEHRFGLKSLIEEYWFMSRSNNITLVAGTQRPRSVSRSMFSEPSWLFIFPIYDTDDLKRIVEIGGKVEEMMQIVSNLPKHHFLCVRRSTRELVVSKVVL